MQSNTEAELYDFSRFFHYSHGWKSIWCIFYFISRKEIFITTSCKYGKYLSQWIDWYCKLVVVCHLVTLWHQQCPTFVKMQFFLLVPHMEETGSPKNYSQLPSLVLNWLPCLMMLVESLAVLTCDRFIVIIK